MTLTQPELKLSYATGLQEAVLNEIKKIEGMRILRHEADSLYAAFDRNLLADIKKLRSIARAYLVVQSSRYNPTYVSKNKSILGNLIEVVLAENVGGNKGDEEFKTFKISCAGAHSPEVRSLATYVAEAFKLKESDEADLKIHIIKPEDVWEVGMQITSRPLSMRSYKVQNMSGAMDPTVAHALNSFCELDKAKSYLNAFSGSATLLIEAGLAYPNLERLIGFDNSKKHLSLSIQNIKEAGLIRKAQVKEADIRDNPDFGTVDVIASDLPFGMSISKGENLEELYRNFMQYAERKLSVGGRLAVYTSEYGVFESVARDSSFQIVKTVEIEAMTSANAYLKTKIIVCKTGVI